MATLQLKLERPGQQSSGGLFVNLCTIHPRSSSHWPMKLVVGKACIGCDHAGRSGPTTECVDGAIQLWWRRCPSSPVSTASFSCVTCPYALIGSTTDFRDYHCITTTVSFQWPRAPPGLLLGCSQFCFRLWKVTTMVINEGLHGEGWAYLNQIHLNVPSGHESYFFAIEGLRTRVAWPKIK